MRKFIVAAAACLMLAGCNSQAADGYTFEKSTNRISSREIKLVLYPSKQAVQDSYRARTKLTNEGLFGYSVIDQKDCTIYVVDPKVEYRPEEIGHELVHCLYGEFHPSQNERS